MADDQTNTPRATNSKSVTRSVSEANNPKSFEMTLSVISAMEQSRSQAIKEVQDAMAAHGGNPFAPGVRASQHLVEALNEALLALKPEAHKVARSNDWALPERV